jgi:hypothetical protein
MSSEAQQKAIHSIADRHHIDYLEKMGLDYGVTSTKELTKKQASELIDWMQTQKTA